MSPINSNGSSLKVTTNFNGKFVEGDGVIAEEMYNSNQQQEPQKPLAEPYPKSFWRGQDNHIAYDDTPRTTADQMLQEAINRDLSSKNIKLNQQTNDSN